MKETMPVHEKIIFGLLIIITAVVIILFFQMQSLQKTINGLATVPQPGSPSSGGASISIDDDAILGNVNAKVTVVEFSDFQCPFCGKFYKDTFNQIKTQYIDTGKVRWVHRDFPLSTIHPFAEKAAEAAECAHDQGKYFEYADKLYTNQENLAIENLKQYAKDLGLDTATFNTCLDTGAKAQEVQNDMNEGISYGVEGTPAFFINGELISGARPFSNFRDVIEKKLTAS
jgi:protein-disulfide isomerase